MTGLQEHFPDPNRPAIGDLQTRNVYFHDYLFATVENTGAATTTLRTDTPLRIGMVRVEADVSGNTWDIQVRVDGRDIFDSSALPTSGGGPKEPLFPYIYPASSVIDVVIVGSSGTPTNGAPVIIEVEPYTLVPQTPQITPHGANRKRPSTRAAIKQFNATGSLVPATVTKRVVGTPRPRVLPIGEPLSYRPREVSR